jgi:DNA-binding response OmpR family regulator
MPKMHGFLVCKEIKSLEQPPKVILLTAVYTKPSYKWEAKNDYGADDMIPKPFVVADLLWRIEQQLSSQFGQ